MTTLSQVIDTYLQVATIAPRTARSNTLALLKIFERVHGERRNPATIPLDEVTKSLAAEYQDRTAKLYCELAGKTGPEQRQAREQALRSSKSVLHQARSIFSRDAQQDLIDRYEQRGLIVPECVSGFVGARLRGNRVKTVAVVPDEETIQRTLAAIERKRFDDPHIFLAFWFAIGGGLRKSEIANLRWEHVREDPDGSLIISGGVGKNGALIRARLQERAADAIRPFRKPDGPVIREGDRWAKRLCFWLRRQGFPSDKLIHELRAIVAAKIYAKSPLAASQFLRHSSIATTEKFYVRRYGVQAARVEVL